jgi:hypothetical protein
MFVFLGLSVAAHAEDTNNSPTPVCQEEICIEGGAIELTGEDVKMLKAILREDEIPSLKYEVITIKNIIDNSVYLLSARKQDYYGIKIILSKEGSKWLVLKKVKIIY